MGISAASVLDLTDEELRSVKFQFLFAPADNVINKRFVPKQTFFGVFVDIFVQIACSR